MMKYFLLLSFLLYHCIANAQCFEVSTLQPYNTQKQKIDGYITFNNCPQTGSVSLYKVELRSESAIIDQLIVLAESTFTHFSLSLTDGSKPGTYMVLAYDVSNPNNLAKSQKVTILDQDEVIGEEASIKNTSSNALDTMSLGEPWTIDLNSNFETSSEVFMTISSLDQLPDDPSWRRNDLVPGNLSSEFNDHASLSIDHIVGRIVKKIDQTPCKECPIYLSIPNQNRSIYSSLTDSDGKFQFRPLPFVGSSRAYFSSPMLTEEYTILFEERRFEVSDSFNSSAGLREMDKYRSSIKHYLKFRNAEDYKIEKPVDSLVIKAPYESVVNLAAYTNSLILDEFFAVNTMKELFKEIVPHVGVNRRGLIWVFNLDRNRINPYVPLILLDGVVVTDHEYILNLDPKDLYLVRVANKLQDTRKVGNYGTRGILALYSRGGMLPGDYPNVFTTMISGASLPEEGTESKRSRTPRFDASFWDVLSPDGRQLNVQFDSYPGTFKIELKTVDLSGRILIQEQTKVIVP